ncbi:F510_1955 family glycosylhydrolase [Salirhabdus salicampi]|uniref:F510_1955 family glycosylhydrolase n=1 Tax=Salirhabdus salicampi TaxID=476102 RepID=UPI0020C2549F|nr:hypothetical protein [Salirhabdus salicampi]MCP8616346.1 hypothetical protein [Salirhabdus salicampi]
MKKSLFLSLILFFIPFKVQAHGTEEEHAQEVANNYWGYGLIVSLLMLVIFLVLFLFTKQKAKKVSLKHKANREKHKLWMKRANTYKWMMYGSTFITLLFLILTNVLNKPGYIANELDGITPNDGSVDTEENITFTHIHGLGYSNDGEEVYVPAHDGLRVYKNGQWKIHSVGERHDYMGFSMFKDGFYSSGHPAARSKLANPLGIIRSTDMGKNIETLDLYREVDFHGMTVGYETEDIYVFNPSKNSRMDQPGFYYSTDQTETWNQASLQGMEGQATALAAHPTESGIVAIGTNQGLYLSRNYGNHFEKLTISDAVTAVSFDFQNHILVGTEKGQLIRLNVSTNKGNKLNIPDLSGDVITYVQQNPSNSEEFVFATRNKNIYVSMDNGETWKQSVDEGVALQ